MKTRVKLNNLDLYLKKFLDKIIYEQYSILYIRNNRVYISTDSGEKVVVLSVKVLKSYSLNELVEMQLNFFNSLKTILKYKIDESETHIFYDDYKTQQKDKFKNLNNYLSSVDIYNYIYEIIGIVLGTDFDLDSFLFNKYRYIVHFNYNDYLVELTGEISNNS